MGQIKSPEDGSTEYHSRYRKPDVDNDFRALLSIAPRYPNLSGYEITGEEKWIIRKGLPWPERVLQDGLYPYAVLPEGEVRISAIPRPSGSMNHPELVRGREVIAAGMIRVFNRKVDLITNESGHYCPAADSVNYAHAALRHWNVPLSQNLKLDGTWECF